MNGSLTVRADRLALVVAILEFGVGLGVYAFPDNFETSLFTGLIPYFRFFSPLMLAGAALLFVQSRYRVSRLWQAVCCLVAAGGLGWLCLYFFAVGNWPFAGSLVAMILATMLIPWFSRRPGGGARELDLALDVIGVGEIVMGALMLLAPNSYQASGITDLAPHLAWMGPMGVISGLVLLLPMPKQPTWRDYLRWVVGASFMGTCGWLMSGPSSPFGFIVIAAWLAIPLTYRMPVPEPVDLPRLLAAFHTLMGLESVPVVAVYQELHSWFLVAVVVGISLVAPGTGMESQLTGPIFVIVAVTCNLVMNWMLASVISHGKRVYWHTLIHIAALGILFADAGVVFQPFLISLFVWPAGLTQSNGVRAGRTAQYFAVFVYGAAHLWHDRIDHLPLLTHITTTAITVIFFLLMGELVIRAFRHREETDRAFKRQLNQTATMLRIASAVHQSLEIEQILVATAQELGDAMKATRSFIILEPDSAEAPMLYHWSEGKVSPISDPHRELAHFVTTVLQSSRTIAVDDIRNDRWHAQMGSLLQQRAEEIRARSVVITPVIMEGKTVGGIGCISGPAHRKWLPEEIGFVEAVAIQVGIALAHARAHKGLAYLADHDALTGLVNRRRFQALLEAELARCRQQGVGGAVLFLDLDQFKYVNDTMGHPVGDALLDRIGSSLAGIVEAPQTLARIGGDEFAVLLPGTDEVAAERTADRIREALHRATFQVGERAVSATVSIGVALYPEHGLTVDDLLARADIALYQAKELGRDRYQLYRADSSQLEAMKAQVDWERRIKAALAEDRLIAYSQPILHLEEGRVTGQELLVRMIDEEGRILSPGEFLGAAERSALIGEIDRRMIVRAVEQVRLNQRSGASLQVNVNLSGKTLTDPGLPAFVQEQFRQSGINPKSLVFEITETAIVSDMRRALSHMEALRALGCGFALDDFGSGFSSFSHLLSLPLDCLKIDGQFVQSLHESRRSQAFVRSVVQLGQSLGMAVTAEFVEQERTAELLRSYGVTYAQGYLVGMPGPLPPPAPATAD